jgi:hypothetical protein
VTSRTAEIQTLIAEIDSLLNNKRLSKLLASEGQQPRQILEKIRNFLASCTDTETATSTPENNEPKQQRHLSPLLARFIVRNNHSPAVQQNQPNQVEVNVNCAEANAFSSLLAPLQAELQSLLQERANLVQEIRQLEQRRIQSYSLTQQLANQERIITDFLQALTSHLGVSFQPQNSSMLTDSSPQQQLSLGGAGFPKHEEQQQLVDNTENMQPPLSSSFSSLQSPEQLQRLTNLAQELDRRLLALDGSVNVVFESLQRNIHAYSESLSQALARMYTKGLQGEQLLSGLIDNLAQQMQLKITSQEPFTIDIHKETLPPDPKSLQAAGSFESPAAFPSTKEDNSLSGDINRSEQVSAKQSISVGDEVEQLYASLFGTNNTAGTVSSDAVGEHSTVDNTTGISHPQVETPENVQELSTDTAVVNPEINPPNSEFVPQEIIFAAPQVTKSSPQLDIADNLPPSVRIDETQATDSTAGTADPWFDEPDAGLLEPSKINTTEAQNLLTETAETPFAENAQSICFSSPEEALDRLAREEEAIQAYYRHQSDAIQQATRTEESYVPASLQQNLLPQPENQTQAVPEISLDAEQLQQLDRDLANFDEQEVDASSQSAGSLEDSPSLTRSRASASTAKEQQQQESTLTQVQVAETEKKKQDTTDILEIVLPSDSNFVEKKESDGSESNSAWYLGLDLGTTGISAVLFNFSKKVAYPIYWEAQNQPNAQTKVFRLPAEVYLPPTAYSSGHQLETENKQADSNDAATQREAAKSASTRVQNLFSATLKPFLHVAVPYKNECSKWEPVLQCNEVATVPLVWVVRSLSKLLLTLKSDRSSTTLGLTAAAVGLEEQIFHKAIDNLAGAICTCPWNWSEQYRFNVREALLISKIVSHPQQVFFVEEAIATLLSELDGAGGEVVQFAGNHTTCAAKTSEHPEGNPKNLRSKFSRTPGNTLIINIGSSQTEMALVDLPENLENLSHDDFMLHGFAYAGKGIEQDIICQLLLPTKWRQAISPEQNQTAVSVDALPRVLVRDAENMSFSDLGLETLNLPRPGEPDLGDRIRLQQRLESSLLGLAVLDAAVALKLILQHQESFPLELADQRWLLHRRDLETQVLVPFVRRINRELNKLLVAKGIPTEAVQQAILTGGTASLAVISRWLRQKLPNARIIQDSYMNENGTPGCSRVAYGLAMLPLHPQLLEIPRHQYTDYFLFTELLRLIPERPLSLNEAMELFEARGINTRTCQQRLLAFLEGELPPGFLPNGIVYNWLAQASKENPNYKAIAEAPLFEKQGNFSYRPNPTQLQALRRYLDAIKASTQQSLEEPYTVNFALGSVV